MLLTKNYSIRARGAAYAGQGMKYQEIARERNTSVATARKQCETLILKLNLENREHLITWAVKNGYGTLGAETGNSLPA